MNFTRRKFLLAGFAVGAAIFAAYKWRWGDPSEAVVAILKRRVGYLKVEPGTFHDFAGRYLEQRSEYQKRLLRRLSLLGPALRFMSPYRWLGPAHPLRLLEDSVVSLYLLSTDFFQNGADEQRAVTYVSFYDPYSAECRNPFARKP